MNHLGRLKQKFAENEEQIPLKEFVQRQKGVISYNAYAKSYGSADSKEEEAGLLGQTQTANPSQSGFSRTEVAIDVLSLLFAEVQNMGALTAIYCHSEDNGLGMSLARTGIVMATQYIVSVMFAPICGHFLDNTKHKRLAIMAAFLITASTYASLTQFDSFAAVVMTLIVQSAISGMYLPGINALSLGLVGKKGFVKRATRNEMWRHAGVLLAGILPMILIPRVGFHSYFFFCTGMACFAALSTLLIDDSKINDAAARGSDDVPGNGTVVTDLVPYRQLLCRKQIMLTIASVVLFHLGNAAMLPMTGQKIDELEHNNDTWVEIPGVGEVDGAVGVSIASVIAELTAIPITFLAGRLSNHRSWGRRRVALVGFTALPIRGVLLGLTNSIGGLLAIQLLDGLGGAVVGVIPILMMQDLTDGTGRFSSMQGGVGAALGLGTAVSQILAGGIAESAGFTVMFMAMSGIAIAALLCIICMKETKNAGG